MTISLKSLHGRILDMDSHEQVPTSRMDEMFGERGRRFAAVSPTMRSFMEILDTDIGDTEKITEQTVWEKKLLSAPSHADMDRRPAVMDMMGIQRQMVFPTMALAALSQALGGLHIPSTEEEQEAAWGAIDAYNEWAGSVTSKYPDRLRVVGVLGTGKPGLTVDGLIAETKRLMKMGVRGLFIHSGRPPAGFSPADEALDPWYALLAEANISICFHSGAEYGYRTSEVWAQLPRFRFQWNTDSEYTAGPLFVSGVHVAVENFITTMVLGGVFARHPTLRVGAIELLSHWIGPLAERLDFLCDKNRHLDWEGAKDLRLKPSEYLNRHVRVSSMIYEPVEEYVERHPYVQDCYCYSTDFPHPEGNKWSMKKFYDRLAPRVSDAFLEKFFVTNGQLIVA